MKKYQVSLTESQAELISAYDHYTDGKIDGYFIPVVFIETGQVSPGGEAIMEEVKIPDHLQLEINDFLRSQVRLSNIFKNE